MQLRSIIIKFSHYFPAVTESDAKTELASTMENRQSQWLIRLPIRQHLVAHDWHGSMIGEL